MACKIPLHIVKDVMVIFRETFHPSICPIIHPWRTPYREENLAEINTPPPFWHICRCLGKAQGFRYQYQQQTQHIFAISGLFPWSAVCCYLTGHKQCKHQDFHWPGSQWIHAKCGIQRGFGDVVCSCNFVVCTVKYTHTYALGTGFKLV